MTQQYTSANTSINKNKLPRIFKLVDFKPFTVNLDYGGGKYDNTTEYLAERSVNNLVFDPYNRTEEHNNTVINSVEGYGGADTATCSNVLNVIKEPEIRQSILENLKRLVKPMGDIYITVYEGSGDGNEHPTKSGYQLNRKTADYMEEIEKIFSFVTRRGKLIHIINA